LWKKEEQRNVEKGITYCGKRKKQVMWNMEEQRNMKKKTAT